MAGMSDTDTVDGTERAIGTRTIPAGEARTAVLRRRYDAGPADVWSAITEPERLARWFLPVTGDLREGGTFDLAGNATGEIRRCQAPTRLSLTWVYGDRPVDEVDVVLTPADGGTILELTHATALLAVDFDGTEVSVLWGLGVGWEPALVLTLPVELRGGTPAEPSPDDPRLKAISEAWAELVEAEGLPGATSM
jgi:uncharacterized protein YndB with AHSA1/START domain